LSHACPFSQKMRRQKWDKHLAGKKRYLKGDDLRCYLKKWSSGNAYIFACLTVIWFSVISKNGGWQNKSEINPYYKCKLCNDTEQLVVIYVPHIFGNKCSVTTWQFWDMTWSVNETHLILRHVSWSHLSLRHDRCDSAYSLLNA
jgi:hypothetical protein